MIVLTSNDESTYKQRRKYLQATTKVLTNRKAACIAYCLTMA